MNAISNLLLGLAVVGVGIYLRQYISKKAENLASKEDLAGLTSIVEAVKTSFRLHEESVKAALAKDVTAHDARFRMELPIYREIWEKYCEVDAALTHVRVAAGAGRTTDGRTHTDAHKAFQSSLAALQSTGRKHDPFFAPEVNMAVLESTLPLRQIAATGLLQETAENQAALERDSTAVAEAVDVLRRAIRDRLYSDSVAAARLIAAPREQSSVTPTATN